MHVYAFAYVEVYSSTHASHALGSFSTQSIVSLQLSDKYHIDVLSDGMYSTLLVSQVFQVLSQILWHLLLLLHACDSRAAGDEVMQQ